MIVCQMILTPFFARAATGKMAGGGSFFRLPPALVNFYDKRLPASLSFQPKSRENRSRLSARKKAQLVNSYSSGGSGRRNGGRFPPAFGKTDRPPTLLSCDA